MAEPSTTSVATRRLSRILRTGALGVVSIAIAASATACGSSGASPGGGGSTGAKQKVTHLTYWSWTKGSDTAVAAFNQTHPNIQVTYEAIPSGASGGYAKISDALKAGNGPDVFNAEYVALPSFVASGQVADISSKFTSADRQGYDPRGVAMTQLGGKEWAVPYDIGVQTMFYRQDLFRKFGLAVPTTWDQFSQEAAQLAAAHPGHYLANLTVDDPPSVAAMVQQAGGRWFSTSGNTWKVDFSDSATQKVEGLWQGMLDQHALSPDASYSTAFTADVAQGKILTILLANWQAAYNTTTYPNLAGKWGVAPMPSFDGQPASGVLGGSSYAINKASKSVDAAVEFAKWMTSDPAAIKARMGDGTSSAYPVNTKARATAKTLFNSSYYGGEDLYSVFEKAAGGLKPWAFGPTQLSLNSFLGDKLKSLASGGKLADAVGAAQSEARSEMSSLGLNVQAGS